MIPDRMDRYVLRGVAGSWAACLVFLAFLFMVFDLLLNMGRYVAAAQAQDIGFLELLAVWGRFHLVGLPWVFLTVAPFVTVVGSMFAVSRWMAANEMAPMIFTGRSTFRVLAPVLGGAVFVAATMGAVWEVVMPRVVQPMDALQRRLSAGKEDRPSRSVALYAPDDVDRVLIAEDYDHDRRRMEGVVQWNRGSNERDVVMVQADAARWDPARGDWRLERGLERSGDVARPRQWLEMPSVTPELVWRAGKEKRDVSMLSYSEILELMAVNPNRADLVVAFHYHFTYPLANLVLLLLTLPFAVSFESGGRLGRVLVAILACGAYLVVDLAAQNLGRLQYVHPVVAAWTPTILFGSLGAVLFSGMRT